MHIMNLNYHQTYNIKGMLVSNKIVDHSDVIGAFRCSWSITGCSNDIFILALTPGFNGLGKDNCKTRWETFKFWDLVLLILEVWRWCRQSSTMPYDLTTLPGHNELTHWGWVTHIFVGKLTIIGLDNGLSPERRQAIIWTNTGILLIGHLGTNCS